MTSSSFFVIIFLGTRLLCSSLDGVRINLALWQPLRYLLFLCNFILAKNDDRCSAYLWETMFLERVNETQKMWQISGEQWSVKAFQVHVEFVADKFKAVTFQSYCRLEPSVRGLGSRFLSKQTRVCKNSFCLSSLSWGGAGATEFLLSPPSRLCLVKALSYLCYVNLFP